jgi:hypothetical protein
MQNVMIQKLRSKAAILAVPILATGAVIAIASPASASVRGVNLQTAGCNIQSPGSTVVLTANNAYGWKCSNGLYNLSLSVDQACKYTYGGSSSAYYLNYSDPYSWRCT